MIDNYAYVADASFGLRVISVSEPSHPTEVGYYRISGQGRGLAVEGAYTYVVGDSGLMAYQFYGGGVEEDPRPQVMSRRMEPTVVRSLPSGAAAFDAMGRRVLDPKPGVYFVREAQAQAQAQAQAVRKIVVTE